MNTNRRKTNCLGFLDEESSLSALFIGRLIFTYTLSLKFRFSDFPMYSYPEDLQKERKTNDNAPKMKEKVTAVDVKINSNEIAAAADETISILCLRIQLRFGGLF